MGYDGPNHHDHVPSSHLPLDFFTNPLRVSFPGGFLVAFLFLYKSPLFVFPGEGSPFVALLGSALIPLLVSSSTFASGPFTDLNPSCLRLVQLVFSLLPFPVVQSLSMQPSSE